MKKFVHLLVLAALTVTFVAGCNTVEGFGKDVKKVGEQIDEKAHK